MNRRTVAVLAAMGTLGLAGTAEAAPPGADDPAQAVPGEILVGFDGSASEQARDRAAGKVKARKREKIARGKADVEVLTLGQGSSNAEAIDALSGEAGVAYAEPNWRVSHQATASDPYFANGSLWGMYGDASAPANGFGSQAAEAWALGNTGSKDVYVGVIDEGIQFNHPDLDGQVWTNPFDAADGRDNDGNGYVDDIHGWDFANNDNTIYDGGKRGSLDDHGTHVAGTIGAKANNGTGVAGVNWNVTEISGKFLGRNGGAISAAIRAVDYFTELKKRGVNVVATNNSWGGGGYSQGLADAISRADAQNILFIAAAGNSGTNNDTTASYPSGYDIPNVLAVAAIDKAGALASFSQYGAKTVDLGAPGVGVWSTTAFNGYSSYNGTSMATPHVTGAAALYAASHPGATAAEIRSAILSSAVPTPSLNGRTVTGGRLNASGF